MSPEPLPKRVALIDLGSNSAQMAVLFVREGHPDEFRVAEELLFVTGLSCDLQPDGRLSAGGRERSLSALRYFGGRLERLGVAAPDLRAVATAGIRRATDGAAFLDEVRRELGLALREITGDEEAELTALAQERSFPRQCPLLVADIGGRSTEVALRFPGRTAWRTSLDVGSVGLGEAHGSDVDALRGAVQSALGPLDDSDGPRRRSPPPKEAGLVGVAGTVTTALQLVRGERQWDPARLHGARLQRFELEALMGRLGAMTADERRQQPGLHPGRADFIVAGIALLVGLMDALGRDEVPVSDRGVRYGLLWQSWPTARIRDGD